MPLEPYDSTQDTKNHIAAVGSRIDSVCRILTYRADIHDASKHLPPEKPLFDEFTPKLKASTYGSPEYEGFRASMGVALEHHYAHNSHHPEHYGNGINGMCLLDLIEMLCDWKAATERHADGDIRKSLEINRARFGISDQVMDILRNTVDRLGW